MYRSHKFYMEEAEVMSKLSKCWSRKVGAVVVSEDGCIRGLGCNGSPIETLCKYQCKRRALGLESGEGLKFCPAIHAEVNAILDALLQTDTFYFYNGGLEGCTLYLNTMRPCKDCMAIIIRTGISRVVFKEDNYYDSLSRAMIELSDIEFILYEEDDEETIPINTISTTNLDEGTAIFKCCSECNGTGIKIEEHHIGDSSITFEIGMTCLKCKGRGGEMV